MSEARPLVSIGMPVYNGEKYLRQALDSLLAQDFTDFELILVEEGHHLLSASRNYGPIVQRQLELAHSQ